MKVKDVMTPEPITVTPETPLKEAAAMLAQHRISGLPVVDSEKHVVGVISEGDILFKEIGGTVREKHLIERWLEQPSAGEGKTDAKTVAEAMTAPAVTTTVKRPLAEVANTMIDQGVKRLPVVDADGVLIGIVTRADLVRAFIRTDEEIAAEIRDDVIRRTLWIESDSIQVSVHDGEVRLTGQVDTKADAEMIPSFVQRVPGVVSVLSKLRWREENGHKSGRLLVWHKQP